MTEEFEFYH
jgi:hypothetical protein